VGLSVTGRQTAGPVVISDTAKATFTVPSMTRSTYQDWQSLCVQQDAETLCDISQTLQVERENGQTVTGLRATVTKRDGFFVMELALPLGLDHTSGMVLQLDNAEDIKLPFATCIDQGCAALADIDAALLARLQRGRVMKAAFRPFGQEQAVVIEVSLLGYQRNGRT
jgi:invasion protein IalB